MILDKEIQRIEVKKASSLQFKRSLFAFGLFVLSIAANLPAYVLPATYASFFAVLNMIAIAAILVAIVLAFGTIISAIKNRHLAGAKNIIALIICTIIIVATFYNIFLAFTRK